MTSVGTHLAVELDPNDSTSLQAQNPTDLGKLRVGVAPEEAAGIPAIWNTMLYGIGEMGPIRSSQAFLKINQVAGFDCQSCVWPSPDKKRKIFEFCENGAKAVSDESTKKRIGPDFFAQYSIADLAAKSDYWLNQQGRLTSPMVRRANAARYQPITWPEAFAMIADELNGPNSPNQACFYTSGKTTNEPAFLLQLFAREFGTNNLPDCSNICHESSGVSMVETLGVGKSTATLEDMESTDLIFIFGNNPGTNHPRMLTSLQMAKDHGAKIIVVNPLPEVGMMRVTNPNPQDYKNPLELPFALLGKGQALADLYLPVRVNGDVAAIKGILKDLFERERAGQISAIDRDFIQNFTEDFEALLADLEATRSEEIEENSGLTRNQLRVAADLYAASKEDHMRLAPRHYTAPQRRRQCCDDRESSAGWRAYRAAILRRVKRQPEPPPFHYFDKGSPAVIGRASAIANVFGTHLSGFAAWLVWAFIHLTYLVTFQSRLLVFIQWAIQDLTFSRGARLITGVASTDFDFTHEVSQRSRTPKIQPEPVSSLGGR